jgi:uncharacterized membrane protein
MKFTIGMIVFVVVLFIFAAVGWGMNVYKTVKLDFDAPYKAEVMRVVSIPLVPVGAVMGYVSFDEEQNKGDE